jgi:hypothetical protein
MVPASKTPSSVTHAETTSFLMFSFLILQFFIVSLYPSVAHIAHDVQATAQRQTLRCRFSGMNECGIERTPLVKPNRDSQKRLPKTECCCCVCCAPDDIINQRVIRFSQPGISRGDDRRVLRGLYQSTTILRFPGLRLNRDRL